MFKYSKDLVPLPIVELFTRNYEFHHHFTRQSQSLHTAVGRNEAIYKTFTFHGIRISGSARHLETWNTPGYLFGIFQDLENLEK